MISYIGRRMHIMIREALQSGRLQSIMHNGNREFISILVYICANRTSLLAGLIYEGTTRDL